jgi:N-acetylmuramoyl-L-alanine amidase
MEKKLQRFFMSETIIIDPGHGGFDAGASFSGRKEKDDVLRLALAVGQQLAQDGYSICYTRTEDRYDSPYDKAQFANNAGGDLFLSFHRNFAGQPDLYQGIQALVYDSDPLALRVAQDINANLEKVGFDDLGIESRKELVVLRRTAMPAVLLEVGFINSAFDNDLFDQRFPEIIQAIADGVRQALPLTSGKRQINSQGYCPNCDEDDEIEDWPIHNKKPDPCTPSLPRHYYVQVGLYRNPENAVYMMEQLKSQGYESLWKRVAGLIAVWTGPASTIDEAVALQVKLRNGGYDTLIVTDDALQSEEGDT